MYNKIYIIGPVGSGKTTLSRQLSKKYNIKKYELDKIVWDDDNGSIKRTDDEIEKLFKEILKNESWIIEDIGREKFNDGIKNADITYYIDLPKYIIYKRCVCRWIKQKIGKEEYNYKPTLKGLFEMIKWAKQDFKNKNEKIERIINNSKQYKILKKNDIVALKKGLDTTISFNNANKRAILIMANFTNIDKIKDIQRKYYDIADNIEPHITVAFPFDSKISDEELYNKLCEVLFKYKPFKIICHGVSTPVGESNYRFLNITLNKDIIKSISDDIYKNVIPEHLEYRDKYNYDPHISLANKPLEKEIELDDTFEMIVDSLYVERIGDNDESIKLYDIKLNN